MATYKAVDLFTKPVRGQGEGTVIPIQGQITPGGAALNDVYRLARIPAGSFVMSGIMKNGDLDTNGTPLLAVKIGFLPVDGSAGNDSAFGSSITQLRAAAAPAALDFVPGVEVAKDSYLVMTVTAAAATFAAAQIDVVLYAETRGAK